MCYTVFILIFFNLFLDSRLKKYFFYQYQSIFQTLNYQNKRILNLIFYLSVSCCKCSCFVYLCVYVRTRSFTQANNAVAFSKTGRRKKEIFPVWNAREHTNTNAHAQITNIHVGTFFTLEPKIRMAKQKHQPKTVLASS